MMPSIRPQNVVAGLVVVLALLSIALVGATVIR